jgi:hypothetical protein
MNTDSNCSPFTRRHFLCRAAAVCGSAATLADSAWSAPTEASRELSAGSGKADITPPLDVGILMSSGRQLWEPFEDVRLPLHARAVVVRSANRRVAFVSLDLLGLSGEAVDGMTGFKQAVVAAARRVVGVDDLVLASTHTHSGPETIALTDLCYTQPFRDWIPRLARGIGQAIQQAASSLRPCRLALASQSMPELVLNRRIETTRGIASVRRQLPPDEVIGPEGPVDDGLRVAVLLDRDDRPVSVLVNFTAHPVVEMCIKRVSPDYPGELSMEIERRHPGCVALFLQGACGNINPPHVSVGADYARKYGHRLANSVDQSIAGFSQDQGHELDLRWKTIELPARNLAGHLESRPLATRIAAARIGDAAFVFLPGEPFVEIALAIREASPSPFTAVVGYAEDYIGYIPTDRAFANGGYEVGPGRWSRLAPGSEAIVREEAVSLLALLWSPRANSPPKGN